MLFALLKQEEVITMDPKLIPGVEAELTQEYQDGFIFDLNQHPDNLDLLRVYYDVKKSSHNGRHIFTLFLDRYGTIEMLSGIDEELYTVATEVMLHDILKSDLDPGNKNMFIQWIYSDKYHKDINPEKRHYIEEEWSAVIKNIPDPFEQANARIIHSLETLPVDKQKHWITQAINVICSELHFNPKYDVLKELNLRQISQVVYSLQSMADIAMPLHEYFRDFIVTVDYSLLDPYSLRGIWWILDRNPLVDRLAINDFMENAYVYHTNTVNDAFSNWAHEVDPSNSSLLTMRKNFSSQAHFAAYIRYIMYDALAHRPSGLSVELLKQWVKKPKPGPTSDAFEKLEKSIKEKGTVQETVVDYLIENNNLQRALTIFQEATNRQASLDHLQSIWSHALKHQDLPLMRLAESIYRSEWFGGDVPV